MCAVRYIIKTSFDPPPQLKSLESAGHPPSTSPSTTTLRSFLESLRARKKTYLAASRVHQDCSDSQFVPPQDSAVLHILWGLRGTPTPAPASRWCPPTPCTKEFVK